MFSASAMWMLPCFQQACCHSLCMSMTNAPVLPSFLRSPAPMRRLITVIMLLWVMRFLACRHPCSVTYTNTALLFLLRRLKPQPKLTSHPLLHGSPLWCRALSHPSPYLQRGLPCLGTATSSQQDHPTYHLERGFKGGFPAKAGA